MDRIQVVSVEGSSYECGYQHGEQAEKHIKHNIDFYLGWWQRNLDMDKKAVCQYAEKVLATTKGFDSGLVDEMRGVADAAGADIEAIAAMNGRYELAWASPAQLMGGCTSIGVTPRRSETGDTMLAQNWDYRIGVTDSCIVLKVKRDGAPTVMLHTEAGIIGHKGMNEKGLGLMINAMVSDRDRLSESVPFLLVCRKMLDSPRFSDAVKVLLNAERSLSYNVMLAGEGVVVDLEAHPDDVSFIYPVDGVLSHTNHFVGERALGIKDNFVLTESNSLHRYIIANEKLASTRHHSFESIKEILTNHFDHPLSICHHPNPENNKDHWEETVSSVFMVPEKRLFMCTAGPPCCNNYETFSF
ncbi:MAG: C45 family peptidase [Candidatus Bathyarchaeota archaeon]|nr:C45 family peptidase [Candidatus Bathyarchaeota archaeon]